MDPEELYGVAYEEIRPENFKVYVGSEYLHPQLSPQQVHRISKPPQFENYNPCSYLGDIAIIELDKDISPMEASPICLPQKDEKLAKTFTAIGYGIDPNHPNPKNKVLNWLQAV
ncbi:hypothetical protein GCK32_018884, partial [Trichostrongylus colubriformis]